MVDDAKAVAALLREHGGNDVVVVELPGGIHRQSSWAAMLPGFLRWAFPK